MFPIPLHPSSSKHSSYCCGVSLHGDPVSGVVPDSTCHLFLEVKGQVCWLVLSVIQLAYQGFLGDVISDLLPTCGVTCGVCCCDWEDTAVPAIAPSESGHIIDTLYPTQDRKLCSTTWREA